LVEQRAGSTDNVGFVPSVRIFVDDKMLKRPEAFRTLRRFRTNIRSL